MRRMENFLLALTSLALVLNSKTLKQEKIPSNRARPSTEAKGKGGYVTMKNNQELEISPNRKEQFLSLFQ